MIVSKLVERILSQDEASRSNDKRLWLAVAKYYGLEFTKEQMSKFFDMPSFETVRRIRQKLQEQGSYQASPEVARHRRWRGMQVQQKIPATNPDRVDRLINKPEQRSLL